MRLYGNFGVFGASLGRLVASLGLLVATFFLLERLWDVFVLLYENLERHLGVFVRLFCRGVFVSLCKLGRL